MLILGKQAFVGGGGGMKYDSPKNDCVGGHNLC